MKKCIRYMIHACLEREEYVNNILVPSLVSQGIKKNEIRVWLDQDGIGNLASFVKSCKWIASTQDESESIWHLQDDVYPSSRFKGVTERWYDGIANGFCNEMFDGERTNYIGTVPVSGSWFSFQCILIPNRIAKRFVDWFESGKAEELFPEYVASGKCDDSLFREYVMANEANTPSINLFPNIADHIDFLIGGTVINKQRQGEKRQAYWRDEELDKAVEELKAKLEMKD